MTYAATQFPNATNACGVDWSPISTLNDNYFVVSEDSVPKVSDFLVDVIPRFGIDLLNVTLAGHSLGGQISGQIGNSIDGVIGYGRSE